MKERIRRACIAFLLTLILLGGSIALLLAYDRMDREMNGIPQAKAGELVIGSRCTDFDLYWTHGICDTVREVFKWIGGVPYAWFETLFFCAKSGANALHQAAFDGIFDFS